MGRRKAGAGFFTVKKRNIKLLGFLFNSCLFEASWKKRGMGLVVLAVVIVVMMMFMHYWQTQMSLHENELAFKRFNISTATNLAESACHIILLKIKEEINDSSLESFIYKACRKRVDEIQASTPSTDYSDDRIVQKIAGEVGGKVKKLTVSLKDVDVFRNAAGENVSQKNEKCGALEIECIASYRGTDVRLLQRLDFKCVMIRQPLFGDYTLFVRDAWGEYSATPCEHFPDSAKYIGGTPIPGAFYGYNSPEQYLYLNNAPGGNYEGKVLLAGPMDGPPARIILNYSDMELERMIKIDGNQDRIRKSPLDGTISDEDFRKLLNTMVRDESKKMTPELFQQYRQICEIMEVVVENHGFKSRFNEFPGPMQDRTGYPFNYMYLSFINWAGKNGSRYTHDYSYRDNGETGIELAGSNSGSGPYFVEVQGPVYARWVRTAYARCRVKPEILNALPPDARKKFERAEWSIYQGLPEQEDLSLFEQYIREKEIPAIKADPDFDANNFSEDEFIYGVMGEGAKEREQMGYNTRITIEPYNDAAKRAGRPIQGIIPPSDDGEPFDPVKAPYPLIYNIKCSNIYDNQELFMKDALLEGNRLKLDGYVFIDGNLSLTTDYTYIGSGIIFVSGDIEISKNIVRDPSAPDSVLTLYAFGKIKLLGAEQTIQASLMSMRYANYPATVGYMTGPGVRNGTTKTNITGNLCVDHLNLPTFARTTVINYDPEIHETNSGKDYWVTLSQKYTYWIKGN